MGLVVSDGPYVNGASLKINSPAFIFLDATICLLKKWINIKKRSPMPIFDIHCNNFQGRFKYSNISGQIVTFWRIVSPLTLHLEIGGCFPSVGKIEEEGRNVKCTCSKLHFAIWKGQIYPSIIFQKRRRKVTQVTRGASYFSIKRGQVCKLRSR